MCVTDDNVSNVFRGDTGQLHRLIRTDVIGDVLFLEPTLVMEAAVEQNVVAAAADQPDDKSRIDGRSPGSADHKITDRLALQGAEADGLDGILRRRGGAE